ncbi:MAG: aspartate kinase [Fimbriimonadaceae bacterium]|nr:aspartate kinase [Fimbriimonadaceae bacterium]
MKVVVLKFGGTSVRSKENRMKAALRVVSAKEAGYHPVVVVSAIGRRGEPYATDTLVGLLSEIDPVIEPDSREMDLMMACGEIISSAVFAHTLKSLGHPAMAMRGGQAGIRTDGSYGSARILGVNPIGLYEVLGRGAIPVVCGFQGVWTDGKLPGAELTTLGRGGSDTTAAAIGAALGAERVEIYTDVDGVKTADPDFVPHAPTLPKVSYDEVAEIAHLGAKVLHPRAAEVAMRFGIPLWVKNTFSDAAGTEVVHRDGVDGRRVTGVTHSGKLVYLQMDLSGVEESARRAVMRMVYETLGQHSFNLYMVNLSPTSFGFAVPRDQYGTFMLLFDGLVFPINGSLIMLQVGDEATPETRTQLRLLGDVPLVKMTVTEGCTMVSLVGQDYIQQPGVFHWVLDTLIQAQVPVLQTSDSDFSVSLLVPESELHRAVHALHDQFLPPPVVA